MQQYNALIVDPDTDDRVIIASKLQEAGWNVNQSVIYHDAKMFLKRPEINLIICNNLIPTTIDGKKLVNEVRTVNKDVYIIILSPVKSSSTINDFITLGANDYIVKPLDIDILLWRLDLKFKGFYGKDFAKVNLAEQDSNLCYFDIRSEVAAVSESYIDILVPYYLELKSNISISSDFIRSMGVKIDIIEGLVIDIQKHTGDDAYKFVARCTMTNLDEESCVLIRRWIMANRPL
jgi:response regulator RpfG family c-di-GMP phosphodiesterase